MQDSINRVPVERPLGLDLLQCFVRYLLEYWKVIWRAEDELYITTISFGSKLLESSSRWTRSIPPTAGKFRRGVKKIGRDSITLHTKVKSKVLPSADSQLTTIGQNHVVIFQIFQDLAHLYGRQMSDVLKNRNINLHWILHAGCLADTSRSRCDFFWPHALRNVVIYHQHGIFSIQLKTH